VTDPVTGVGASPLAEVPALDELPTLIRLKYMSSVNRWTTLRTGEVATLSAADSDMGAPPWRQFVERHGIADVASTVLRDRYGCWGFLDLWRTSRFRPDETAFLRSVLPELTRALRTSLARTFVATQSVVAADGPVVLLLSDDLVPRAQTPHTDTVLRALLPTPPDRAPVPAVALNVAAQLLAVEAGVDPQPPIARLHATALGPGGAEGTDGTAGGRWLSVRAARISGGPGDLTIAVTLERPTRVERTDIYTRTLGLSPREAAVLRMLISGADTRGTARALGMTEHTVNAHLKAVFGKADTTSRRVLVARATG
jgi:DNA-binding CsgD family transcriptional regulator